MRDGSEDEGRIRDRQGQGGLEEVFQVDCGGADQQLMAPFAALVRSRASVQIAEDKSAP
jgi:hypothetical protein